MYIVTLLWTALDIAYLSILSAHTHILLLCFLHTTTGLKTRRKLTSMKADALGIDASACLSNTLCSYPRVFEYSVKDRYEEQTIARWHEFWPQRTGKKSCRFTKSVIRDIFKSLNIKLPPQIATIDAHQQLLQQVYATWVMSSK